MNQSKKGLNLDTAKSRFLQENVSLVLNLEKSCFVASQRLEIFGCVVNAQEMTLLTLHEVYVSGLFQLIGKLTASIQEIFPACLHYRYMHTVTEARVTWPSVRTLAIRPSAYRGGLDSIPRPEQ